LNNSGISVYLKLSDLIIQAIFAGLKLSDLRIQAIFAGLKLSDLRIQAIFLNQQILPEFSNLRVLNQQILPEFSNLTVLLSDLRIHCFLLIVKFLLPLVLFFKLVNLFSFDNCHKLLEGTLIETPAM
jgi:hypothetical protein